VERTSESRGTHLDIAPTSLCLSVSLSTHTLTCCQVCRCARTVPRALGETLPVAQLQTTARIVLWVSIEVLLGKLQTPVRIALLANSARRRVCPCVQTQTALQECYVQKVTNHICTISCWHLLYAGLAECTNCPAGTWRNVTGGSAAADCTNCVPGKFKVVGGQSSDTCELCPAGKLQCL